MWDHDFKTIYAIARPVFPDRLNSRDLHFITLFQNTSVHFIIAEMSQATELTIKLRHRPRYASGVEDRPLPDSAGF